MPHYRKCPNCGYVEPIAWRGSAWHPDWEIADYDEAAHVLIELENLRDKIGEGHRMVLGEYVYWRQKGKNEHLLHRIPLVVFRANGDSCRGKGSYAEKRKDPFQIELEAVSV